MILKAVQTGESIAIIIPRKICEQMDIHLGDHVSVEIRGKVKE